MQGEVDVAIIGAGVAGLSAARSAADNGLTCIVIEATDRIGGRAFTDHESFGIPFDRGAHRLHHASRSTLVEHAFQHGFSGLNSNAALRIHDGHWHDASRQMGFERETRRALKSLSLRAATRQSSTVRQMLDVAPDFADLFDATYENVFAAATNDVAAGEHYRHQEGQDGWTFASGLGTLVKHFGRDLNVTLDCPVTEIDHRNRFIQVVTARGTIRAKSVIVTVSTGVLARESIRFVPPLPPAKLDAIEGTPMGHMGKIAFALSPEASRNMEQHQALVRGRNGLSTHLHVYPHDQPILVAAVGGLRWEMIEKAGASEMTAAARELVLGAYGAEFGKDLRHAVVTDWLTHPFTHGGQSYVRPGYGNARAELARPIDGRIFFAGEACSQTAWGTVHGAHETGRAAVAALTLMR